MIVGPTPQKVVVLLVVLWKRVLSKKGELRIVGMGMRCNWRPLDGHRNSVGTE